MATNHQIQRVIFLLINFILIACVDCRNVSFTDCGKNQVKSLDITPCEYEPCTFTPGNNISVTVVFEASREIAEDDEDDSSLKMIVDFVSVDVEYPGLSNDMHTQLDYPLIPGSVYNYTYQVVVKEYLPLMTTLVTWTAGSNTFCAQTNVTFETSETDETPNPNVQ